jgi:hypothetical protein
MPYARELIEPIEVLIKIQAAKIDELTNENNALKKLVWSLYTPQRSQGQACDGKQDANEGEGKD